MTRELTVRANAKINLFLGVTSRRSNGYHEIDTVMQSVSLCDTLSIRLIPSGIRLSTDTPGIPDDGRNTAYRAAEIFFEASGVAAGAEIHIKKAIPFAAGLGGGSADAAAVFVALNSLCGDVLDVPALRRAALKVGADVPFCISGGCVRAAGVGEIIRETLPVTDCAYLIVKGGESVSTPTAYAELDRIFGYFADVIPENPDALLSALRAGNVREFAGNMYNIFEKNAPALCPEGYRIREFLSGISYGALLSGSGPSVFAVFGSTSDADNAAREVRMRFPDASVAVCIPEVKGVVSI